MNNCEPIQKPKKPVKSISIKGTVYIPLDDFVKSIGISKATAYQWNLEGKIPFAIRYLGRVYYEAKAIEPFKESITKKVRVYR